MGEITKIQWTDHTFNPWIGCAKVAPGCEHCYAEADMDKRRGRVKWGINGTRSVTSDAYWRQPIRWNKQAESEGVRRRVFCASLADVFEDREELWLWRANLFDLIDETPNLDWLLLTKRPENILKMWPTVDDCGIRWHKKRPNIWLGTSISDQATADKAISKLLKCRDLSPVLFVSAEPLLGPIDLDPFLWPFDERGRVKFEMRRNPEPHGVREPLGLIDWVIIGGESGPKARPCNIGHIADLVRQCQQAGVAPFVKQVGSMPCVDYYTEDDDLREKCLAWNAEVWEPVRGGYTLWNWERDKYQPKPGTLMELPLKDKKGGDPTEWPTGLVVREFPIQ